MFENIGKKIKLVAKIITYLGIALSAFWGVGMIVRGNILAGVLVIFLGSLVSWGGSLMTYGFGELIDKATEIESNTRPIKKDNTRYQTPTHNKSDEANQQSAHDYYEVKISNKASGYECSNVVEGAEEATKAAKSYQKQGYDVEIWHNGKIVS